MTEQTITDRIQAYEYLYKVANKQITPDNALTEQAESFFTKEELQGMVLIYTTDIGSCFPCLKKDHDHTGCVTN